MQDTPHSAGAAHTEAELWAGRQRVSPPRTQYSHTTLSNLKLSPLVESCPRSIYSTGRAGRGLGSRGSGQGAPAVHGAPALGPARAAAARPCRLHTPLYPYTDKRLAWIRTKLQAVPWRGDGEHCPCCSAPARRTREDARRGRSKRGSSGTCCTVGLQPLQESWLPASNKAISSYTARVALIWDRCLHRCQFLRTYVAYSSTYYRDQAGSSANK